MRNPPRSNKNAGMPKIPVRAELEETSSIDPLEAYQYIANRYGRHQTFLFESLSGPAFDCRFSYIMALPVVTLAVTDRDVRLDGAPQVVERLRRRIVDADIAAVVDASDETATLRLPDPFDLWRLLREVRDGFELTGATQPGEFSFGLVGYMSYDVARAIERLPRDLPYGGIEIPDVLFAIHRLVIRFDMEQGKVTLVANYSDAWPSETLPKPAGEAEKTPSELLAALGELPLVTPPEDFEEVPPPTRVSDGTTKAEFLAGVDQCLEHIRAGDIYQVQLGHEIHVESEADPFVVYRRLRSRNPSPFMYFGTLGEIGIVGASPELFVRREGDTCVVRPIAGTIGRGSTQEEDLSRAVKLRADPKEIAEHMMLVDLCRNDISRICVPGTMKVPELAETHFYSHVIHLVSTVTGEVREGMDEFDLLIANFPAGTMVGTPKISAMTIIEKLETTRRGVYAGTVGMLGIDGYLNTALCIRTAVYKDGVYALRASAGVVADSNPEKEWLETIHKMSAPFWAVAGRELRDERLGD